MGDFCVLNEIESPSVPNSEPIAVCGLSLNFPQDASSENGFWNMLLKKRSAMTAPPPDRLNIDGFRHYTQGAHYLKQDLGAFDANFFSITPSEASAMDPMHRILLETTYKAFESAGIRMEDLKGSRASVHTGCFTNDYLQQMLKDSERLPPYAAVGGTQSMLANRVSWFYDLRGPSVNLDSACSSSAMAVDLSCQLLHSGVTDLGVVAGCNLLLDPDFSTILSNMQMLSPDGRCYTFDHRANGYSRGEGVAVVILKRLSDALRDNDTIRAVIRASGSNQDGRTPGITQPDAKAQAQLISETYQRAGLSMEHTRFFEAHGTGTALGDPIELGAIVKCFQGYRDNSDPLHVGSVKTNIGHLEGASGIAGLIKAILVVESGIIPPNANFESINRKLAGYDYMISLPSECTLWPPCQIRRASINSFGYGGTNSHIVVDDAISYLRTRGLKANFDTFREYFHRGDKLIQAVTSEDYPKILVWSAFTNTAVREMISAWDSYCSKTSPNESVQSIADIAYTLDSRRSLLASKSFAVVSAPTDLLSLSQLASVPVEARKQCPRLAFIFTGQGAQWFAMGRELFTYPVFVESIHASETILTSFGCSWSAEVELKKSDTETLIDHPEFAQCLTAVIQIAIVDLLKSFAIKPVAVVGHSMGEIAAAYCADLLTHQSALRVAFYRGLFTATLPQRSHFKGAMLAVALPVDQVTAYFDRVRKSSGISAPLVISCINSPSNTTVSGEESAIEDLHTLLDKNGVFARRIRVPVAYHSSQMNLIVSDCVENFAGLESPQRQSNVKMISSVTGAVVTRAKACEAAYWTDNMVSPVLFSQAVQRLLRDSERCLHPRIDLSHRDAIVVDSLIEVGPHAALKLPIQQILDTLTRGPDITYFSALYRKQSASLSLLRLVGQLHCLGYPIKLRAVNEPRKIMQTSRVSLPDCPKYPFDHSKRYWAESPLVRNYRLRTHGHVNLLGSPSRDWNPLQPQWRCHVRLQDMPWLLDHKLNGKAIYPASAFVVMALQGISEITESDKVAGFTLRNVRFDAPISMSSDSADVETRLQLNPLKTTGAALTRCWAFSVFSVSANIWVENCTGTVEVHLETSTETADIRDRSKFYEHCLATRSQQCSKMLSSMAVYNNFTKSGFHYGPSFQGIRSLQYNGVETVVAELGLSKALSSDPGIDCFVVHPASLDSFFHLALVSLTGGYDAIPTQAISRIDELWISADGLNLSQSTVNASARLESETHRTKVYSAFATAKDTGHVKTSLLGLQTTVISSVKDSEESSKQSSQLFWCGVETAVDIDALSPLQIIARLDKTCGPNPIGPSGFFLDLRHYLQSVVKSVYSEVKKSGVDEARPHFRKYVDWMEWHISMSSDVWTDDVSNLRQRIKAYGFLGDFFLKVADNALDVLQGRSDMVQLIFEDDMVEKFYEENLVHSSYYEKLQAYLEYLSFKNPSMNFLEIGAGTGSFTERILKAVTSSTIGRIERFKSYYYTDISPAFFDRARDRFSTRLGKMNFGLLDAERDPLDQGFHEQTFDVIAASNVLHVTKSLDNTLQNLRKLLKPGGKLILHEYVHPERIEVGFVFGLLAGWWPDDADRTIGPLASEDTWDKLLRRNGFSGADFALRDFADEESHLMSIMCATAVETPVIVNDMALANLGIAIEPLSRCQKVMADSLISRLGDEGHHAVLLDLLGPWDTTASYDAIITLFDLDGPILSRMDENMFYALKTILKSAPKTLWVSRGGPIADPSYGMIDGFARVFRIENIRSKLTTLALDPCSQSSTDDLTLITSALHQVLATAGFDHPEDYVVQDGVLCLSRIYEHSQFKQSISEKISGFRRVTTSLKDAKPFKLSLQSPEISHSLRIIQDLPEKNPLGPDEIEIDVQAVGFNSVDVKVLSGLSNSIKFGRECAGIVTSVGSHCDLNVGDHVCAYGTDVLGSTSRTDRRLVARIPSSMSFEQAATLPQDCVMANYLIQEARIRRGDLVIVRGGDTKLGMATLLALEDCCATVYTTVSSPGLENSFGKDVKIFKDGCFAESLNSHFNVRANVVFDFSNADLSQLVTCVSKFGNIFSVRGEGTGGGTLLVNCFELPPTIGFKIVDVVETLAHLIENLEMPFAEIRELPTSGLFDVKVADISVIEDVTASVRSMGSEERLAVKYNADSQIEVYHISDHDQLFSPCFSYVISGGLGDLGRSIAKWMAHRGARYLILLSRSGPRSEEAKSTVQDLQRSGVRVCTPLCDIADIGSLHDALQQLEEMPPVKGCIQTAGALKDIVYENMSFEDWKVAVNPKTHGSWNLHCLLPKGMDFFILTSSISGIMGQATQINYASGNTYQDALAKYRLARGEKAVSLDLGILATGGLVSHNEGLAERLAAENVYTMLSESEILALFQHFCDPRLRINEIPSQIVSGFTNPASQDSQSSNIPPAFSHPFWSQTLTQRDSDDSSKQDRSGSIELCHALEDADSFAQMSEIMAVALADQLCNLTMTSRSEISMDEPLHVAGADSLSAVYLRNWIMRQFAVEVAVFDILGDMSIVALGNLIIKDWLAARSVKPK